MFLIYLSSLFLFILESIKPTNEDLEKNTNSLFCADMACEGHWHTLLMFTTISDCQLNPRFYFYSVPSVSFNPAAKHSRGAWDPPSLAPPVNIWVEIFSRSWPTNLLLVLFNFHVLNFLFWCWPWTLFFPFYCYSSFHVFTVSFQ